MALRGIWTNDDTMTADDGIFSVGGTFDLVELATLDDTGASFRFEEGLLENTGTTFTWLSGYTLGSNFEIEGGTIETVGGATFPVTAYTTWDGVTIDDDVTVSSPYRITIQNGLTLNGTLTLAGTTSYAHLYFSGGAQTLGGTGEVVFTGTSYGGYVSCQSYHNFTIGSGITLRGGPGILYAPYSATLLNQGTIAADTSGATTRINGSASAFVNEGVVSATNGGDSSSTALCLDKRGHSLDRGRQHSGCEVGIRAGQHGRAGDRGRWPYGSNHGVLVVTGSLDLDGELDVQVGGTYSPVLSDVVSVITYTGTKSGAFATTSGLDLGGGLSFGLYYVSSSPNRLDLKVE